MLRVNSALTSLNLTGCASFVADGCEVAVALRVNSVLTDLKMCSCQLGPKAGTEIAETLRVSRQLTCLDIAQNFLEGAAAMQIASALALSCPGQACLDVRENGLGREEKEQMRKAWAGPSENMIV